MINIFELRRVGIIGSRTLDRFDLFETTVESIFKLKGFNTDNILIVSGGQRTLLEQTRTYCGTDFYAEKFAHIYGYRILELNAEWARYEKRAGPIRNIELINFAHEFIVFWDGKTRGTKGSLDYIKSVKKPCKLVRFNEED